MYIGKGSQPSMIIWKSLVLILNTYSAIAICQRFESILMVVWGCRTGARIFRHTLRGVQSTRQLVLRATNMSSFRLTSFPLNWQDHQNIYQGNNFGTQLPKKKVKVEKTSKKLQTVLCPPKIWMFYVDIYLGGKNHLLLTEKPICPKLFTEEAERLVVVALLRKNANFENIFVKGSWDYRVFAEES